MKQKLRRRACGVRPSSLQEQGSDYNLDGVANDRPNAIATHVGATHEQWADGFNLPDSFFSAPCLGCVGNLGRNTFVGPGYLNLDTSLFKNIRVSDRFRLQFRADAFNILNHTNFQLGMGNGPSGNNRLNSPEFGKAGGTFNPRNLQFGLKLSFDDPTAHDSHCRNRLRPYEIQQPWAPAVRITVELLIFLTDAVICSRQSVGS